jgi:hypothetical protein
MCPGPIEHNRGVTGYGQLARLSLQRAARIPAILKLDRWLMTTTTN